MKSSSAVVLVVITVLMTRGNVAEEYEHPDIVCTTDPSPWKVNVDRITSFTVCFLYKLGTLKPEVKGTFQDNSTAYGADQLQKYGINHTNLDDYCTKYHLVAKKENNDLNMTFTLINISSWTEVVSKSIILEIILPDPVDSSTIPGSGEGQSGSGESEGNLSPAGKVAIAVSILVVIIVIGIVLTVTIIAVCKKRSQSQGVSNEIMNGTNVEDSALDLDVETDSPRKASKNTASTRQQNNLFHRKVRQ